MKGLDEPDPSPVGLARRPGHDVPGEVVALTIDAEFVKTSGAQRSLRVTGTAERVMASALAEAGA